MHAQPCPTWGTLWTKLQPLFFASVMFVSPCCRFERNRGKQDTQRPKFFYCFIAGTRQLFSACVLLCTCSVPMFFCALVLLHVCSSVLMFCACFYVHMFFCACVLLCMYLCIFFLRVCSVHVFFCVCVFSGSLQVLTWPCQAPVIYALNVAKVCVAQFWFSWNRIAWT